MATNVFYNGVELHNVLTKQWDEEIVYDPSGTDVIRHTYKLRFAGILHTQYDGKLTQHNSDNAYSAPAWISLTPKAIDGVETATTPTTLFAQVRAQLGQARKRLQVVVNGEELLAVDPAGDPPTSQTQLDCNNGPQPKLVSITNIIGNSVYRIEFAIECSKIGVQLGVDSAASPQPPMIVNNRWSVAETIDDKFFTTRTIKGRMRLSTPYYAAHAFRKWVVPPLEDGFRRDHIEYVAADNGLDVEYTVTDRQVANAAPWPACRMDCTQTTSSPDGVSTSVEVTVKLEGSPEACRAALLVQAILIIEQRLNLQDFNAIVNQQDAAPQAANPGNYLVEGISFVEHIGEANIVEARMRIKYTGLEANQMYKMLAKDFGSPLDGDGATPKLYPDDQGLNYNPKVSRTPKLYGYDPYSPNPNGRLPSVLLYLLECYLQVPWDDTHACYSTLTTPTPTEPMTAPQSHTTVSGSTGVLTQFNQTINLSTETKQATYLYARAENRYFNIPCRVQMPVAGGTVNSSVFTLAKAQGRREIHVDFERIGIWPEIPEPMDEYYDTFNNGQLKGTLLRHWERALPPSLGSDYVQTVYRLEAYYLYALDRPITGADCPYTGILPQTSLTQNDTSFVRANGVYTARMAPGEA